MPRTFSCSLLCGLLLAGFVTASPAEASPVVFTGTSGPLSASASFEIAGGNLVIVLTNTSGADALIPADLLTGVFFGLAGDPALTPLSATLGSGSDVVQSVWSGSTQSVLHSNPGSVGGEFAYRNGLNQFGANQGISSSGLGIFGPSDRFPGANLAGSDNVGGLEFGILPAGDNPATGNVPLIGKPGKNGEMFIHNSVTFTFAGLPTGLTLNDISNVSFQFGTSLAEPRFPGDCIDCGPQTIENPEPGTLILLASGLLAGAVWNVRFRPRHLKSE